MCKYHYIIYGLKIESDIEIEEALSCEPVKADVMIRSGANTN